MDQILWSLNRGGHLIEVEILEFVWGLDQILWSLNRGGHLTEVEILEFVWGLDQILWPLNGGDWTVRSSDTGENQY